MRNILAVGCLTAALSLPSFDASAMSIMPAIDTGAPPPITRIAGGCGASRYRGVDG